MSQFFPCLTGPKVVFEVGLSCDSDSTLNGADIGTEAADQQPCNPEIHPRWWLRSQRSSQQGAPISCMRSEVRSGYTPLPGVHRVHGGQMGDMWASGLPSKTIRPTPWASCPVQKEGGLG